MWNKDIVELLIIQYQEHEHLYNIKHPKYLDRIHRANSLVTICKKLKELDKNITVEDIKRKIHTLRTQYIKEYRDVENKYRESNGTEVYEPKLWCYRRLEFLKPFCAIKENGLMKNKKYDESNMEEEFSNDGNFEAPDQSRKRRRKALKLDSRVDNLKTLLVKRLEEKSEYDWLGKQVVFEMKSLKNKKIQQETAWKIQTVLREASIQDAAIIDYLADQPSNEHKSDTRSSFSSSSPKEQSVCSSFLNNTIEKTEYTQTQIQPCPIRILSAQSYNQQLNTTGTSYLPSPDILQQSVDDL